MKKAGIITYWQTKDNYGSILQNYALQKVLAKYDIESETLYFRPDPQDTINKVKNKNPIIICIKLFNYVIRKGYISYCNLKNKRRNFKFFINSNIKTSPQIYCSELEKYCSNFDLCLVGSDQIWNTSNIPSNKIQLENSRALFLGFAPKNSRKIACAVSFGKDNFNPNLLNHVSDLIHQFDFISVREHSGIDICKKMGVKNVFFQPDPTLLLSADSYRSLVKIPTEEQKFVLLYLLNNDTDFDISKLKKWAKNKKLKLIYINGNTETIKINLQKKVYPTIAEWISLIDNAEYIFTNSFHGTIFSIIMNKKFMTITQKGKFEEENTRFNNLLQLFNLQHRIFNGNYDNVNNSIDYTLINMKIEEIQRNSPFINWLNTNITRNND